MIWKTFKDEETETYFYVAKQTDNLIQYVCKVQKVILSDDYNLSIYSFDEKGDYALNFSELSVNHQKLITKAEAYFKNERN